ncbi:MAG: transcription antitermination factor NusB [Deltaproteobacteria bacterium]|nr:transcription antitermination factor NusB [Deltaproteobacteria bacterium]
MGIRRKSRELALQSLYQAEMNGGEIMAQLALLCDNFHSVKEAVPYATTLLTGIQNNYSDIDKIISQYAKNWRPNRMSVIDRNLLRIGVFEVFFAEDVPSSVAINEAIEVAKRFSTDDSASFINGILDAVSDGEKKRHV